MFKFKKILFLVFVSGFFIFSTDVWAKENVVKVNYLESYKEDLARVENYLNSIKELSAKFMQLSGDGEMVEGRFYLSRPGKMRIEYLGSSKVLIVVNGAILAYKDLELDETSYLTTNSTPASFLTRNNISFAAKDIEITEVVKSDSSIKVSLLKKNRKEAGEFSLIFTTEPLQFLKMEVKNDLGEIVTVDLEDMNFNPKIDSKIFSVKNTDASLQ